MRIPLTIARLPELDSLSSEERKALLAECRVPNPLRLWTGSLIRGMFLTAIVFLFLHLNDMTQRLAGPVGAIAILLATFALTWLMHAWTIIRIRGQLRLAIESASRDGLVPICLSCGHDCSATQGSTCPECGVSRHVGSEPAPGISR